MFFIILPSPHDNHYFSYINYTFCFSLEREIGNLNVVNELLCFRVSSVRNRQATHKQTHELYYLYVHNFFGSKIWFGRFTFFDLVSVKLKTEQKQKNFFFQTVNTNWSWSSVKNENKNSLTKFLYQNCSARHKHNF